MGETVVPPCCPRGLDGRGGQEPWSRRRQSSGGCVVQTTHPATRFRSQYDTPYDTSYGVFNRVERNGLIGPAGKTCSGVRRLPNGRAPFRKRAESGGADLGGLESEWGRSVGLAENIAADADVCGSGYKERFAGGLNVGDELLKFKEGPGVLTGGVSR